MGRVEASWRGRDALVATSRQGSEEHRLASHHGKSHKSHPCSLWCLRSSGAAEPWRSLRMLMRQPSQWDCAHAYTGQGRVPAEQRRSVAPKHRPKNRVGIRMRFTGVGNYLTVFKTPKGTSTKRLRTQVPFYHALEHRYESTTTRAVLTSNTDAHQRTINNHL